MDEQHKDPTQEIRRLQRCINDLVGVLALPATWSGTEPSLIVHSLLDAILRLLPLDLVYMRLKSPAGEAPIEIVRVAQSHKSLRDQEGISEVLTDWFGDDPRTWSPLLRKHLGDRDISLAPLGLGLQAEIGVMVAGSYRADFPRETEKLILSVAANQAAIGLQQARLLSEQKRVTSQLDQRVAQRTAELAATNEELRNEIAERRRTEGSLRESEQGFRLIVDGIAGLVAIMAASGEVEVVNRQVLDYFGRTVEELKEWSMSDAVHPEDLAGVISAWEHSIRTASVYDIDHRLRRTDGEYRWFHARGLPLLDAEGRVVRWYVLLTDIHDRKRAEEGLLASERNLTLNINAMPTLVASARPDGWGDFFNQRWLEYTGLSSEQLQGWGWADPIHPDDAKRLLQVWRSSLATGAPLEEEARMRRFDGAYRWLLFRANALRDESGAIVKWYGTTTDIEDRKRADEALRLSERELRSIINTVPTLAWSADPDGSADFLNQRWLDFTGLSAERAQGWGWGVAIHPDDMKDLVEHWQSSLASGLSVETEARMRRYDGVYRWFLFRASPLRDEVGNIVKWYGTNTDIEDRKQADKALRASERNLSLIIETIPGLVWCAAPNGKMTYLNQSIVRFMGRPLSELLSGGWADLIHPEDRERRQKTWAQAVATGEPYESQFRLRRSDGVYRWVHSLSRLGRTADGKASQWYGLLVDVDQHKRADEALVNARSELANVTRITSLGVLTASIAHEVNQPLSGIVTNASTCLRMLNADPPNVDGARETARRTIRDGNRASDVITRLKALFSKKEVISESIDLNEATQEVIALSLSDLQRNQVILKLEFAEDLHPIRGDRVQLQQVILNLIRNASDAMSTVDDRPRHLLIRTERDEDNQVRLTVEDSGVGFDPQAAGKLFEGFYTTKNEGMGIGLSVSRSIIEAHKGRLWAEPNDGPGATFSFCVPCGSEGLSGDGNNRAPHIL
jgi:PAS domain S-box-containing protein